MCRLTGQGQEGDSVLPPPTRVRVTSQDLPLLLSSGGNKWAPKEHTRGGKGLGFQCAPHGNLLVGRTSLTSSSAFQFKFGKQKVCLDLEGVFPSSPFGVIHIC